MINDNNSECLTNNIRITTGIDRLMREAIVSFTSIFERDVRTTVNYSCNRILFYALVEMLDTTFSIC